MTTTISPTTVIPLRPDEVPKDLICAICLSVPLDPRVTPNCFHVFCKMCIREHLGRLRSGSGMDNSCPVCRGISDPRTLTSLKDKHPITYRIWTGITVKCQNHSAGCGWTGSVSDYEKHLLHSCQHNKQKDQDKEVILSLREELRELKSEIARKDQKLKSLEVVVEELRELRHNTNMTEEIVYGLKNELNGLKRMVNDAMERPMTNGRGGYTYDRHSVVRLTKLICQSLDRPPSSIDTDKIFRCVVDITSDLGSEESESDNYPKAFFANARMLLAVCLASAWFSNNQLSRLRGLASENGWL